MIKRIFESESAATMKGSDEFGRIPTVRAVTFLGAYERTRL